MGTVNNQPSLKQFAASIRIELLKMLKHATYGHIGGSMSMVDLLAVLYQNHLNINPSNPQDPSRDYVVLSKGHAGPGLYATLSLMGYFDASWLNTLNQIGTRLPSHPDRLKTPGIDVTTGSLGQGTSIAAGLGYGIKLRQTQQRVYLIVGDGELNEGQCWEAFQFIAHHKMNRVMVIIDDNKKQLDGYTKDIINPFNLKQKMESFGFCAIDVKGNDLDAIDAGINYLKSINDQAVCMILDTIKGQGVPYFETMLNNHSVRFNEEDYQAIDLAIESLKEVL